MNTPTPGSVPCGLPHPPLSPAQSLAISRARLSQALREPASLLLLQRCLALLRDNRTMHNAQTSPQPEPTVTQARNPLHGLTLETIVTQLADFYGWDELGNRIPVRCFTHDPSVSSSLKFLRKTPWAREKVESLYLYMLREQKRQGA